MKLKSLEKKEVESNLSGQSYNFGIKDSGVIIEILRNRLYSHPIRTLVQEYLSNARDASRESNKEETPILVTLPTEDDPTFKVRDFGPGLSEERVRDVFVYYGTSTKRKDDTQTGGFGIGAKSAWAYTDSFVIISYYNGKATHYLAHIGKTNEGTLEVIKSHSTKEQNGTEIQIGVSPEDVSDFISAAERATFFWEVRPSFVNSQLLSSKYKETKPAVSYSNFRLYEIDKLDNIVDVDRYNPIVIVIDGIPYPIDGFELEECENLCNLLNNERAITIHVGNGFCEVSASREAISDSAFSKDKISKECKEKQKEIISYFKSLVNESSNLASFIENFQSIKDNCSLGRELFKKKFGKFEFSVNFSDGVLSSDLFNKFEIQSYRMKQTRRSSKSRFLQEKFSSFKLYEAKHFVFVDEAIKPMKLKQKIKGLLFGKPSNQSVYVFSSNGSVSKEENDLLEQLNCYNSSELSIAVNQNPNLSKRTYSRTQAPTNYNIVGINEISPSYRNVSFNHKQIDISNLTPSQKFIYMTKDEYLKEKSERAEDFGKTVNFFLKEGYTVCFMADRFIEWTKSCKNFISVGDYVSNLTPRDLKKMATSIECSLVYGAGEEIGGSNYWNDNKYICLVEQFAKTKVDSSVKDKSLKPFFKKIGEFSSHIKGIKDEKKCHVPKMILSKIIENNKQMKKFQSDFVDFFKYVENNYSLVYDIVEHCTIDSKKASEVVAYMNAKSPSRSR